MSMWNSLVWLATVFVVSIVAGTMLVGCHVVEINMVQRAIVDSGDGTNDKYSKTGDTRQTKDEETMELIVPLK